MLSGIAIFNSSVVDPVELDSCFVGFALSSVEGRVAMEFFDLSEAGQAKKYVFIFR